jgi:hypothetical protein
MVNVLRRINRNFDTYAVELVFDKKHELVKYTDDLYHVWLNKKDALRLAAAINRKFSDGG